MAKKRSIKQVNLRLPDNLVTELNDISQNFGNKERTLAAAVMMFCQATKKSQWLWYQKASGLYGAGEKPKTE